MPPSQKMYKKSRFSSRTEAMQYTLHNLEKKLSDFFYVYNLNTYFITLELVLKCTSKKSQDRNHFQLWFQAF